LEKDSLIKVHTEIIII